VQALEGREELAEGENEQKAKVKRHKFRRKNFEMKKDRVVCVFLCSACIVAKITELRQP